MSPDQLLEKTGEKERRTASSGGEHKREQLHDDLERGRCSRCP